MAIAERTKPRPSPLPLDLRVRRIEGAPVVAVRLWARGGARSEELPGQAVVTGRALAEGTASRDWRTIADQADDRGMTISSFGTFEGLGLSIDALAADWELALDWAAEIFLTASFPGDRCAWMAKQAAAELESLADQREMRTSWKFMEQLYAPHPRRRPVLGDAQSLAHLEAADCAAFHRRALDYGLIAAVAGVVDAEAVERRLAGLLRDLAHQTPLLPPEPPAPLGLSEARCEVGLDAGEQAHLYAGHLTVPRHHPDYAPLEALAVILGSGSGLNGRIPARIREREGLAYSAQAHTVAGSGLDPGRLVIYVGTSVETLAQAERGVVEEVERVVEAGITEEELAEARAYLLGREPFRRETARQVADLMIEAAHYAMPLDDPGVRLAELAAVSRESVEAAAGRHIDPRRLRVTVGLPREDAEPSGA